MAPELLCGVSASRDQRIGRVSPAADVYSFSLLLWEMMTGSDPYSDGENGSVLQILEQVNFAGCNVFIYIDFNDFFKFSLILR